MSMSVPKKRARRSRALSPPAVPERLHDRDERSESERQRDEEEVVERGRRELEACEIHRADAQGLHPRSIISPRRAERPHSPR